MLIVQLLLTITNTYFKIKLIMNIPYVSTRLEQND